MSPPDLSLDAITVIAECLAGDYAFGSLASLHLANHAVREETMPVLYETVLMDKVENLPYHEDGTRVNPVGFRYTKFRFCAGLDTKTSNTTASQFPNLLATIVLDRADGRAVVHIHRPVSCAALFGVILPTPIHHQQPDVTTTAHCAGAPGSAQESSMAADQAKSICAISGEPSFRSISAVRQVYLHDNACLTPDKTVDPKWTAKVQLGSAWLNPPVSGKAIQPVLDTLFELLKLIGRSPDVASIQEAELQKIKDIEGPSSAQTWPKYRQHNLGLEMSPEAFEAFVERFAKEVVLHPEIFLNRLEITIKAEIGLSAMSDMVDQLVAIYQTHVTSYRMLLPGVGPPYKLCTLLLDDYPTGHERTFEDMMVPMEKMSVEVEGPEGDMKFTNSDVAYMAEIQEKIGRVAAMARARGEDGQCRLM